MDTNLLRSWLGLSPGPWPPDDRALLGLPPGAIDPANVERRALQLMSRLRSHQLVHPELVTEGMNRLAQAMLAVTMSANSLSVDEPPVTDDAFDLRPGPPAASRPTPVLEAVPVLDAKPVEGAAVVDVPSAPSLPGIKPGRIAIPPPAIDDAPEGLVGLTRANRRAMYRELAGLRALVRAWDHLHSSFGTPGETLPSAAEVFDILEGVAQVRDATAHPGLRVTVVEEVAPRIAAILRQPLAVGVYRSLTPAQHHALAKDWAKARSIFTGRTVRLRKALRESKPGRPAVTAAGMEAVLANNPEWVLVIAMLAVFTVAAVRLALR